LCDIFSSIRTLWVMNRCAKPLFRAEFLREKFCEFFVKFFWVKKRQKRKRNFLRVFFWKTRVGKKRRFSGPQQFFSKNRRFFSENRRFFSLKVNFFSQKKKFYFFYLFFSNFLILSKKFSREIMLRIHWFSNFYDEMVWSNFSRYVINC